MNNRSMLKWLIEILVIENKSISIQNIFKSFFEMLMLGNASSTVVFSWAMSAHIVVISKNLFTTTSLFRHLFFRWKLEQNRAHVGSRQQQAVKILHQLLFCVGPLISIWCNKLIWLIQLKSIWYYIQSINALGSLRLIGFLFDTVLRNISLRSQVF